MPEQEFLPPRPPARSYRPDRDDEDPPPWANLPPVGPTRPRRPAGGGHRAGPGRPASAGRPGSPSGPGVPLGPNGPGGTGAGPAGPGSTGGQPAGPGGLSGPGAPGGRPGGPGGARRWSPSWRLRRPGRRPVVGGSRAVRSAGSAWSIPPVLSRPEARRIPRIPGVRPIRVGSPIRVRANRCHSGPSGMNPRRIATRMCRRLSRASRGGRRVRAGVPCGPRRAGGGGGSSWRAAWWSWRRPCSRWCC